LLLLHSHSLFSLPFSLSLSLSFSLSLQAHVFVCTVVEQNWVREERREKCYEGRKEEGRETKRERFDLVYCLMFHHLMSFFFPRFLNNLYFFKLMCITGNKHTKQRTKSSIAISSTVGIS
jgi:hypothetical protein